MFSLCCLACYTIAIGPFKEVAADAFIGKCDHRRITSLLAVHIQVRDRRGLNHHVVTNAVHTTVDACGNELHGIGAVLIGRGCEEVDGLRV